MKGGFKSRRIFCMGFSRVRSRLTGVPARCLAKGFPTNSFTKDGIQIYKCRFHGGQNTNFYGFRDRANRGGYNKPNYTEEKKIKSLASLKQFRDKPLEYVREYYEKTIKPRIDSAGRYSSKYSFRAFRRRQNSSKYKKAGDIASSLNQVLSILESRKQQGNKK